jgi:hypothetical protein
MCVNVAMETRFSQTSIHGRVDTKSISSKSALRVYIVYLAIMCVSNASMLLVIRQSG